MKFIWSDDDFERSGNSSGITGRKILAGLIMIFLSQYALGLPGGEADTLRKTWTLDECISYALNRNIQVLQARSGNNISMENLKLAKSAFYPSAGFSARENFSWGNQTNQVSGSTVFSGSNGTNLSVSSGMPLFNGFRLVNNVKKAEADYEAGISNLEVIEQTISLNILDAYLQVLFAVELVSNSVNQVEATTTQLNLAGERMRLGVISNSDYLQVRSQLATENLTLAKARSQLAINRVILMQLMEMPVNDYFNIASPNPDSLINLNPFPGSPEVYRIALAIKPEIRQSELNRKSSALGVEIARADHYPQLSVSGGISTLYSDRESSPFTHQIGNNISPSVGISASVPIYSNRLIRSRILIAKEDTVIAGLNEINAKNQLRKAIEQACLDVSSSQAEYLASREQFQAAREAMDVATEKYAQGIMSSVDYVVQKTAFITAESNFLQSKYRLVFNIKTLDFYMGKPLTF